MRLFLTYLILLWVVNAWHDSDYYNKKDAHLSGAFLAILIGLGFFMFQYIGLVIRDSWDVVNLIILTFTIRFVVFPMAYNKFIKPRQSLFFIGTTAFMDGGYKGENKVLLFLSKWIRRSQVPIKIGLLFYCLPVVYAFMNYLNSIT